MMNFRIGYGFDVHPLGEGRKLWLGGIEIPYSYGLIGHSDADVLLHAICDSLLGALALGDIGKHFPNTDTNFKGIDSKILLAKTYDLIKLQGYFISNIDATLVAEAPKINPYVNQMQEVIAEILHINQNQVSIKATTNEKLGYIGRLEGMVAHAVTLVYKS
jgi:2-C-methyl-D-erythritol 2,4-cyclodiphosphate synthase